MKGNDQNPYRFCSKCMENSVDNIIVYADFRL